MDDTNISSLNGEPAKSPFTRLADEVINTSFDIEQRQTDERRANLAGKFLLQHRQDYGQEAVDNFFIRLRNFDPSDKKSFSLNKRELATMKKVVGTNGPLPEGSERTVASRRAFLTAAGLAVTGFVSKTVAEKITPRLAPADPNANQPARDWATSAQLAAAGSLQYGSIMSYVWAAKKAIDAYYLQTKGLTAQAALKGQQTNDVSVLMQLHKNLNKFLEATAKEKGLIVDTPVQPNLPR
jgi:hypothetical protein